MKNLFEKVIDVLSKTKKLKFFPVVDERGFAEQPKKFFPVSERDYLLAQRRKGIYGNGQCTDDTF